MMMVRFLVDTDREVTIPGSDTPQSRFEDMVAPFALALEQERRVTRQIHELTRTARDENDFAREQFMQWFIKEQVEEVAAMHDLLQVVTRAKDDIQYIEGYASTRPTGDDPTAPSMAGI
jgi:ferritin